MQFLGSVQAIVFQRCTGNKRSYDKKPGRAERMAKQTV